MSVIVETVERDGRQIHVYDSGMERDASTGYIVKPAPHTIITTAEKSSELHRALQEQKRARILTGAARHLKGNSATMPSNLDVVEAIGEKVMEKALDPKNAKQVDAARFILQESGLSESQQQAQQPGDASAAAVVGAMLIELARNRGLLSESAISASNKVRIDEQDSDIIDASPASTDEGK